MRSEKRKFRILLVFSLIQVLRSAGLSDASEPIRLVWSEGDVAGYASIFDSGSRRAIGFVEYRQNLSQDVLSMVRIAHYLDGSSDEDWAEARIGPKIEALRGGSIIRDADGVPIAEVTIDVTRGRVQGSWVVDGTRFASDEQVDLPAATYWGPLVFIAIKNFEANSENGRLVFRTVAPTPRPRVLDLEVVRRGSVVVQRFGTSLDVVSFVLRPTVNRFVDPLLRLFVPSGHFLVQAGAPPALVRFSGPRNYAGQEIIIE